MTASILKRTLQTKAICPVALYCIQKAKRNQGDVYTPGKGSVAVVLCLCVCELEPVLGTVRAVQPLSKQQPTHYQADSVMADP